MDFKKKGVFSPCESLDSASMIKCLQAFLNCYPKITFNSVSIDKKYLGFKIFFTDPEDSVDLGKSLLSFEEQPICIFPLTANLIILGVNNKKSPLFERDLRDAINKKFGRVLEIVKTDTIDQFKNHCKNWRIEIDMPEFKGLKVFQDDNFSGMTLSIPSRNENVTLRFWCRHCTSYGHFQHECLVKAGEEKNQETKIKTVKENNADSNMKAVENTSTEKIGENFRKQPSTSSDRNLERTPERFEFETTERYAEKIGIEEALSFSKEKDNNKQNNTTTNADERMNNVLRINDIKKEIDVISQGIDVKESENLGGQKYKFPEFNSFKDMSKESQSTSNKTRDSISDDDDEIEYIGSLDNFSNKSSESSSARAEIRNYEEESRSSPEMKTANNAFPASLGPSYDLPSAASKSPKGAEVTTALSERLQECINEVCIKYRVLDRKKLDAFLIHVKKKSNPIRVALNYTANTKGLKEQLKGILDMYYNTPQTGTKEDIQFIKWLNGLVDRYDGSIPKKRKRSAKTGDEHPAKR